jgi:CelD/BcsL family acetyltransferase involved in cellulose biosynthesis
VRCENHAIGYLYNYLWKERVYVLQTGFRLEDDKRLMPGYVTHVMAIDHNLSKGMKLYDLMHGDSVYKQVLCDTKENLVWYSVQRKIIKYVLEDAAVNIVRRIKALKHN